MTRDDRETYPNRQNLSVMAPRFASRDVTVALDLSRSGQSATCLIPERGDRLLLASRAERWVHVARCASNRQHPILQFCSSRRQCDSDSCPYHCPHENYLALPAARDPIGRRSPRLAERAWRRSMGCDVGITCGRVPGGPLGSVFACNRSGHQPEGTGVAEQSVRPASERRKWPRTHLVGRGSANRSKHAK